VPSCCTEPKKLRAADFSWEAPPSPFKTSISSSAIYCSLTASQASLRSPKRVKRLLLIRERMPPPKLPLTAVSEPDPIYPYLPFLFWVFSLAMTVPSTSAGRPKHLSCIFPRIFEFVDSDSFVRKRTQARHTCKGSIQDHRTTDR
jgi:hypothetical protein